MESVRRDNLSKQYQDKKQILEKLVSLAVSDIETLLRRRNTPMSYIGDVGESKVSAEPKLLVKHSP